MSTSKFPVGLTTGGHIEATDSLLLWLPPLTCTVNETKCKQSPRGQTKDLTVSTSGFAVGRRRGRLAAFDLDFGLNKVAPVGGGRRGGLVVVPLAVGVGVGVAAGVRPALVLVEHGQLRVAVHAEPVLGIVDGDQILNQLRVGLTHNPAFAFCRSEHRVVVKRVVDHRKS